MRDIRKIIVHCTDSDWGNVAAIDYWHRQRGWDGIGYHFLITNAYPEYEDLKSRKPNLAYDGMILEGRAVEKMGAHTRGHNLDSIGIALVGKNVFSKAQIYSLIKLVKLLINQFGLTINDVYGHYEFNPYKSCPNINMDYFRERLYG